MNVLRAISDGMSRHFDLVPNEMSSAGLVESRECGPLAQRSEQRTHNPLVEGSNPSGPTIFTLRERKAALLQAME